MDLFDGRSDMIHVAAPGLIGSPKITAGNRIHDCPVVGQPDPPQSPTLILGINDMHADRREQPQQFAIAADAQQHPIKVPACTAEHTWLIIGICNGQGGQRRGDQLGMLRGIITTCCSLRCKGRHGPSNIQDIQGFSMVQPPYCRGPVAAEIKHTARGKMLHSLAHSVPANAIVGRKAGLCQHLSGDKAPFLKVLHDAAIDALG